MIKDNACRGEENSVPLRRCFIGYDSTSFPFRVERRGFFCFERFSFRRVYCYQTSEQKRRERKISWNLVGFSVQNEVNDAAVGCIDFPGVAFDIDGGRGVAW